MEPRKSVLIVGGGLSGLTAAALLAHRGIRVIVVERHAGTSIQYKFTGISPRSMEIFRSIGLEADIRNRRTGDQQGGGIARAKNLADPDIQWSGPAWADASQVSPTQPATCDQHVLEPILRSHAEMHGAEMRFDCELLSLDQDGNGVTARLRDLTSGREEYLSTAYLIAADGAHGATREKLGIERRGPGVLQHWMSIIFDTDLPDTIAGRRFTACFVTDLNGTLVPRSNGRWLIALQYAPERGERPEDFDAVRCRDLVVTAAGRSGIKADLVDARAWEAAAYVADRFRHGRCFLIGDAAHLMPPTGGFGGNAGIHDAHNLAWKLALVIDGEADPALLDSYDTERRAVAEATLAQALARLGKWFKDPGKRLPPPVEVVDDYDVVFGQLYRSSAILTEAEAAKNAFARFQELSGEPGTRAPHFRIARRGQSLSTHDLFGKGFVLLAGENGQWAAAAAALSPLLRCHRFGTGGDLTDPEGHWPTAFGVTGTGAIVIRPDGFVAWRAPVAVSDPGRSLADVMRRLTLRMTGTT